MDFSAFNEEDFIANESFQNWVFQKNEEDVLFWEDYIIRHPKQRGTIYAAVKFLVTLNSKEKESTEAEIKRSWSRVEDRINAEEILELYQVTGIGHFLGRHSWLKVVAIFISAIISAICFEVFFNSKIIIQKTAHGEVRTIKLPDGSTATLNGNSALKYYLSWSEYKSRIVWLEGEAFFNVTKQKVAGGRFLVYASKELKIEALGTTFSVSNRKQRTNILLSTGRLRLQIRNKSSERFLYLSPGEFVQLQHNKEKIIRKNVNPVDYSGWHNQYLFFDNTSLGEVAEIIEIQYNTQVEVSAEKLLNLKVAGPLPNRNLEGLLEALKKALPIKITRKPKKIIIEEKNKAMNN